MVSIIFANIVVSNIDEFGKGAEREGFEPSVQKFVQRISNPTL